MVSINDVIIELCGEDCGLVTLMQCHDRYPGQNHSIIIGAHSVFLVS